MSDDDRDLLAGISVMLLAIANRQNLAQQQMQMEEEPEEEGEVPCGAVEDGSGGASVCTKEAGHVGRHKYRTLTWTAVN